MNETNAQQALLDAVAEEFTARFRQGERPSIEEYAARHPEAAEQIRGLLPSIVMLEQMKPQRASGGRGTEPAMPKQLGDYAIVREVGRGGMGIVYEAVQQSLGRRVALKVLPHHARLDERRLERFRIEAQAAARLHHTNIVPVFGLFESDGLQYYVMQFIDGHGLDAMSFEGRGRLATQETQALAKSTTKMPPPLPLPSTGRPLARPIPVAQAPASLPPMTNKAEYIRRAARMGMQVAQALDYAHSQGILHRDIKPANLLLDQRGTVWITDFGLAKLRENDGLTATGDLVGTLQYMAPEALHGQSGPQSDVYSLGATLYELITRQPCFRETSPARLLKQISEQEPVRPRSLDRAIPRDLETIVLKAMAREPRDRYRTAGGLADDLSRFLEDRPIRARRSSSVERFWRWSRRNRGLAASMAAAMLSLVLASVVGWWAYASTTHALVGEENRRIEAELATAHAEANMQLSLHALEEIFAAVAPPDDAPRAAIGRRRSRSDGHPGSPGNGPRPDDPDTRPPPRHGSPEGHGPPGHADEIAQSTVAQQRRSQLLEAVLAFYERFAQQNATDPKLQCEAAKAQLHVGDLLARLGETDKARQAVDRSIATFANLAKAFPKQSQYLTGLLEGYRAEALLAVDTGDQHALQAAAEKVQAAGERLAADFVKEGHNALLAATYADVAELCESAGDLPTALKFFEMAASFALYAVDDHSGKCSTEDLAAISGRLAAVQVAVKQPADARATLERSIDRLRSVRPNRERDELLAEQYRSLADLTDDTARAAELRGHAEQVRERRPFDGPPQNGRHRGPHKPDLFGPPGPPPLEPFGGPPPPPLD